MVGVPESERLVVACARRKDKPVPEHPCVISLCDVCRREVWLGIKTVREFDLSNAVIRCSQCCVERGNIERATHFGFVLPDEKES